MKETRFRAWDKENNTMLTWEQLKSEADFSWFADENSVFMQYTGLVDKHGVEIYEGDWIRVETQEEDNGEFPIGYVVRANDEPNMFIALPEQLKETGERQYHLESLYEHYSGEFEVIGNIYQNKDIVGGIAFEGIDRSDKEKFRRRTI